MANDRAVENALRLWRDAERRLEAATPGTTDYIRAALEVEDARRGYANVAAERLDKSAELGQLWSEEDVYRGVEPA
jgi:hypothetical protein